MSPYVNYILNDYVTFISRLDLDWDQKGDQAESTKEFNKNMDDVARLGVDFNLDYGITAGTFIEFAIEDPTINKSTLGANLRVTLF